VIWDSRLIFSIVAGELQVVGGGPSSGHIMNV